MGFRKRFSAARGRREYEDLKRKNADDQAVVEGLKVALLRYGNA